MTARRSKASRPRMVTEESTLASLERLPGPQRMVLVHVYLVAAFWPWWLTLFFPVLIAWRIFSHVDVLGWATGVLGVLALGGWFLKGALEDRAAKWADRTDP